MAKRKSKYREALTSFNRTAGQIRRRHPDIDPESFLPKTKTAAAVERAKEKLKFAAERQDILARVKAYEERRDRNYEQWLKDADKRKKQREAKKARKSLNKHYPDLHWNQKEYDDFWDVFGNEDIISEYGSDQVIALYEDVSDDINLDVPMSEVADLALGVAQVVHGSDTSPEEAVDMFNYILDVYKKIRADNRVNLSMGEISEMAVGYAKLDKSGTTQKEREEIFKKLIDAEVDYRRGKVSGTA